MLPESGDKVVYKGVVVNGITLVPPRSGGKVLCVGLRFSDFISVPLKWW